MSGPAPARPLRLLSIADREATTPKPWVVAGLFAAGEVSGLVAPPAAGKSAIAVDIAGSVAIGELWFSRKVATGAAVYVAAERYAVTLRRLRAFAQCNEVRDLDVRVIPDRLDLLSGPRDAERLLAAVRQFEDTAGRPVRLITIDTVRAVMPGGDENSPRDMGNLARHIGVIRDGAPDAHVQLLHHTPKGRPAEASGHTALTAMLDAVMVVAPGKGERRSWSITEANDLPAMPPRAFFELYPVVIGKGADGEPITAPVVRPIEQAGQSSAGKPTALPADARTALSVLEGLVRGTGPIDLQKWREAALIAFGDRSAGAKRQAFSTARKLLIESGTIRQDGETVSVSVASG
jgi:AAA domain